MTTRAYQLRTRTEAGTAAQPQVRNRTNADPAVALYSDIAASRPPSPRKEMSTSPAEPVDHPSEEVDSEGVFGYSKTEANANKKNAHDKKKNTTSSDENEPSRELEEQPWTPVRRRRAQSLDSVPRGHETNREREIQAQKLTTEQDRAVKAAVLAMNQEQSELIQRRQERVITRSDQRSPSRGEGPSNLNPKGKAIDPREWGNVDLNPEELDVEAQAAALNSLAQQWQGGTRPKAKPRKRRNRSPSPGKCPSERRI